MAFSVRPWRPWGRSAATRPMRRLRTTSPSVSASCVRWARSISARPRWCSRASCSASRRSKVPTRSSPAALVCAAKVRAACWSRRRSRDRSAAPTCRRSAGAPSKAPRPPACAASPSRPARASSSIAPRWPLPPTGQGGSQPLIYIIAGEPSGDALGGRLMAALRERSPNPLRFAGIGGEHMAEHGIDSLVPLHELAIMGVAEVLPRARRILRRVAETVADIQRLRPAAVVTIDSSGFTWRVAQRLRRQGERLPLIHYVAPMVWAWRGGRARRMARWYDHLLVLLPFEPPYFTRVGLACTYVGHPVVESGADHGDGAAFRQRHGVPPGVPLLTVLPGSRRGEVARLLAPFAGAVAELARRHSDLRVVVPTTATVVETVSEAVLGWPAPTIVLRGEREKYDAFAASDAALAASGTAALEAQVSQCRDALHRLGLGELSPSRRAADEVLAIIARHSRERNQTAARPEIERRTR